MRWGRLAVENHRGVLVPRVLGIVLAIDAVLWTLVSASVTEVRATGWGALVGSLLVFAAGLVDDLAQAGPRGLRAHVRSLLSGRVTTGIVKLIVIAGSAVVVVTLQPDRPGYAAVCGVVLLAACANVWNGLDVAPGRALKAFVVPALVFLVWGDVQSAPLIPGLLVGAVVVLPFDLRELAMLGDGGANLVGFCAGLALYDVLPDPWVVVAAAIAVALNVVADTVSFSRVIDGAAPLRWVDALGRRR
jgi:UDP-GlcNAc:undecaprenyl-phosphate/decaprenyl-phosphate GlcNAc-1-phosphate transferase